MKRQIRKGVFETNSSSTHSLTMCTKSDFEKWVNGELVWNSWYDRLEPITNEVEESMKDDDSEYLTYEQFNDWDYLQYETFEQTFETPSREKVVAFGYYGYN